MYNPTKPSLVVLRDIEHRINKTGTPKVGGISKAQKAQFLKCVGRFHEKLLFSNLLTKTQYSSDITAKVRI